MPSKINPLKAKPKTAPKPTAKPKPAPKPKAAPKPAPKPMPKPRAEAEPMAPPKSRPGAKGASGSLETRLDKAIGLFSANKVADAVPQLESIAADAEAAGRYDLARFARIYLSSAKKNSEAPHKAEPLQEAVFLVNSGQSEDALEILNKIIKKDGSKAEAHYLKSLALAKSGHPELSAESLKSAIEIDSAFAHVYKLEPDFKPHRNAPAFAVFESD
jgi:tetratricopeptide (TPR) repeat protein